MLSAFVFTLGLAALTSATPNRLETRQKATVITKCSQPNVAALTFDDGPYKYLKTVGDTLTAAGAKGTFFFNGNNYDCIYGEEEVKNMKHVFDQGHQIGSHTWSHAHLKKLSEDDVVSEVTRSNDALKKILGVVPQFVRPPYGEYNDVVLKVLGEQGQSAVLWDFDSGDSTGSTVEQSEEAYTKLIEKHPENILALNHETYATTANDVLPFAIKKLQSAGYKLVTVAECVGHSPYISVISPSKRDSSWKC